MGKFIDADQLKEEIAKEPVWASLSVIEIIDKLTESQTIFYPQVDGITPSVIDTPNYPAIDEDDIGDCDICKYVGSDVCDDCFCGSSWSLREQNKIKKTREYCDSCNHISCVTCKGDKDDPYCVPSNYEPCIDRSTE